MSSSSSMQLVQQQLAGSSGGSGGQSSLRSAWAGQPMSVAQQPYASTTLQRVEHSVQTSLQSVERSVQTSLHSVERSLHSVPAALKPQAVLPKPVNHALHTAYETLATPFRVALYVVQPWKWQVRRAPASVARVTLRNNFVALSGVVVLWYLGAWGLIWEGVKRTAGSTAEIVLKRLLLFSLIANIIESAYILSYPTPLPAPIAGTVPTYKPTSVSPAHRRLIERSLQDLPAPSSSPFSSPSKLPASLSRSASATFTRTTSSSNPLSSSRLASSSSSFGSTLRQSEASRDPLNPDNPESPLRAFEGRHSPKSGRALGPADLERMRREKW
ncbi:hypothetical protein CALCODRAFT_516355 [Calocera cornea HHB12733]|uniref:Uncharacterized protein n=1 Tax=Calocera cornea HHB12733 TaxID=1353952 RepID=A0A165HC48_9BASI|nr:hypothetical protein CALCODRAFT_516355 [Calocera cornea HHB12733]